jgi:hypothetical protein
VPPFLVPTFLLDFTAVKKIQLKKDFGSSFQPIMVGREWQIRADQQPIFKAALSPVVSGKALTQPETCFINLLVASQSNQVDSHDQPSLY